MKKIFFICLLFSLGNSFAAKKYLRKDGSDGNTGTVDNAGGAWLTAQWASAHASAYDTVIVDPGTYTEVGQVDWPVTVSLIGKDSATCIFKSTVTSDYVPMFYLSSSPGTNGQQTIQYLKFDCNMTAFLPMFITRGGIKVYDCTFINAKDRGLYFSATGNYTEDPPIALAFGNEVRRCRILNCGAYIHPNGNFGMGCLNIGGQDSMVVTDCVIIQNQRDSSRTSNDNGWPIKYANFGENQDLKIYNNYIRKNRLRGDYNNDGDWDFAIELWNSDGGVEIYNNEIHGAVDMAYSSIKNGSAYGWWVHDNHIFQQVLNDKPNIGLYTERNVIKCKITNNHFEKVTGAISVNVEDFPPQDPRNYITGQLLIKGNLMHNLGTAIGDGNNGFGVHMSVGGTGPDARIVLDSLIIDHNTIVADPGNRPFEGISLNIPADSIAKFVSITSNVIVGFYDYGLNRSSTGIPYSYFRIKNNLFYGNAAGNAIGGTATITVLDSSGNIGVPPVFTDTSTHNFTPGVGSPLINAGYDGTDIGYTGGGDVTAPTVTATNPASSATGVSTVTVVTITFDGPMDAATLIGANLYLTWSGGTVTSVVTPGSDYAVITPSAALLPLTVYTVHVQSVKDAAGNTIASPYTYTFTTGAAPFRMKRKTK